MARNDQDDFLPYYNGELTYLRRMGRYFAQRYPKIAARLELTGDHPADPHVERLIESFAFLTARIKRQIDSEFPELTSSLLGILYPHLTNPAPPMAIAHFEVDPDRGKLTSGHFIPKHTALFTHAGEGLHCRFRTCYPVTLWPLEVVSAGFEPVARYDFLDAVPNVSAVLRLRLKPQGVTLDELAPSLKRLRFYLDGESTTANALYELLFCHVWRVAVLPVREGEGRTFTGTPTYLKNNAILPVGFDVDEEVLPYPPHAHPGYRLLQEYFLFPEKYHFFDLDGVVLPPSSPQFDVLILLDRAPRDRVVVDRHTFRLGCTPIANLFRKTTEPIRLDHRQLEYRLVPDSRRERTMEIHTIQSVSASSNPLQETSVIEPFYSFRHRLNGTEPRSFWHARRVPTGREDMPGTDILLSFFDLDFDARLPPTDTVYAHTLCTNRELAVQVPAGARLQVEESIPHRRIACLRKPTYPAYPPSEGAVPWNLISNLSLNYLSLSEGKESLEALREILRLYSFSDQPSVQKQVQGMRELVCRRKVRRIGHDPWRGFCQGTEITLEFDEDLYVGSGAFLLGAVLNRFFALYASINSFTELVMKSRQREGEWKRWPPLAGEQPLI